MCVNPSHVSSVGVLIRPRSNGNESQRRLSELKCHSFPIAAELHILPLLFCSENLFHRSSSTSACSKRRSICSLSLQLNKMLPPVKKKQLFRCQTKPIMFAVANRQNHNFCGQASPLPCHPTYSVRTVLLSYEVITCQKRSLDKQNGIAYLYSQLSVKSARGEAEKHTGRVHSLCAFLVFTLLY
jgi:hypothetical protein